MSKNKNKKRILYYSILNYSEKNLNFLKKNFDLVISKNPKFDKNETLEDIQIIFAPLGYYLSKEKILMCKKLEVIISNTTSDSHIDTKFAMKKNIKVITLKNQDILDKITPTAEHTVGMIMAITRNYIKSINSVKKGNWDRKYFGGGKMLSRSTIGVVGLGRLGFLVGKYLENLGARVIYYDPYKIFNFPNIKKYDSLIKLIKDSDVITLHLHPLPSNQPILNINILKHFTKKKFLINTSRGDLVDEKGICDLIKKNKLAGYATDVLQKEFLSDFDVKKNPIYKLSTKTDKILIFPHIGGSTYDAWHETQKFVLDKAISFYKRESIDNIKILDHCAWALITARGGSKSIPLKNLAHLNKISLIKYTFNIINKNKDIIKKSFCSSDSKKIKKIAIENKINFIKRSKKLSGDNVSSQAVVKDFLDTMLKKNGYLPEFIFLFEPTSPFVRSTDIKKTYIKLKKNKDFDSSQTVTKVSSNSHAYNQRFHSTLIKKKTLYRSDFYLLSKRQKAFNKQNKPQFYIHGNLRLFRTKSFLKYNNFFGKLSLPIEIPKLYAFDVDDKHDLKVAEALIKTNQIKIL